MISWISEGFFVILFSTFVIGFASRRSKELDFIFEEKEMEEIQISTRMALLFPLFASFGLLLVFYFNAFGQFLILSCFFSSSFGLFISLHPLFKSLLPSRSIKICGNDVSWNHLVLGLICVIIFICWILTANAWANNVLGVGIVVTSISMLRIPSFKIACILLSGLFFYDIFWVFFSSYFFGENVMTSAANKTPDNPAAKLVETLNIPINVVEVISPPTKLIFQNFVLGLGDLVLPGVLAAFTLRFDKGNGRDSGLGYHLLCMIGYFIGLMIALICAFQFQVAQPALLYIVPSQILPLVTFSASRGEFAQFWIGETEEKKQELMEKIS